MDSISEEVIILLNKKQEAAFDVVFNIYYPRLVYFAKEYIPYDDAKNVVQDAFIMLWNKKPFFANEAQLQSYIYTSVKNSCLMYLRHEKVKKVYQNKIGEQKQNQIYSDALGNLDTSVMAFHEIETILEDTLNNLPPRCKEVFTLSRLEGKKNKEIADLLAISVKAVEAQITKALKVLSIALKDYLPIIAY